MPRMAAFSRCGSMGISHVSWTCLFGLFFLLTNDASSARITIDRMSKPFRGPATAILPPKKLHVQVRRGGSVRLPCRVNPAFVRHIEPAEANILPPYVQWWRLGTAPLNTVRDSPLRLMGRTKSPCVHKDVRGFFGWEFDEYDYIYDLIVLNATTARHEGVYFCTATWMRTDEVYKHYSEESQEFRVTVQDPQPNSRARRAVQTPKSSGKSGKKEKVKELNGPVDTDVILSDQERTDGSCKLWSEECTWFVFVNTTKYTCPGRERKGKKGKGRKQTSTTCQSSTTTSGEIQVAEDTTQYSTTSSGKVQVSKDQLKIVADSIWQLVFAVGQGWRKISQVPLDVPGTPTAITLNVTLPPPLPLTNYSAAVSIKTASPVESSKNTRPTAETSPPTPVALDSTHPPVVASSISQSPAPVKSSKKTRPTTKTSPPTPIALDSTPVVASSISQSPSKSVSASNNDLFILITLAIGLVALMVLALLIVITIKRRNRRIRDGCLSNDPAP